MTGNKKLFLSAVSSEFVAYRNLLADDLKRPSLDVAVQEDFVVTGHSTLEKLDTYIRACDGVVHLIGKATGGMPEAPAVAALLAKHPDLAYHTARGESAPASAGLLLHAVGSVPGDPSPAPALRLSPHRLRARRAARVPRREVRVQPERSASAEGALPAHQRAGS